MWSPYESNDDVLRLRAEIEQAESLLVSTFPSVSARAHASPAEDDSVPVIQPAAIRCPHIFRGLSLSSDMTMALSKTSGVIRGDMAATAQPRPATYHSQPHVYDVRRLPERPSRALIAQVAQEQHPDLVVKNRLMERRKSSEERLSRPCFEEITEVDEEEASTSDSSTGSERMDGRSPYVMTQIHSPATYTSHPLLSPKFIRRSSGSTTGRLMRGNSDPIVRKRSLGSLSDRYHGSSFDQLVVDFLCLPSIPEAGTPASPHERSTSASADHEKLQFIDEKDDLSDSSESSYMTV